MGLARIKPTPPGQLPLTVVISYFGMNFEFGEYKLPQPHLFAPGLLLASGVATLWYLRRRGRD